MSKVTSNFPSYNSSDISIGGSKATTQLTNGVLKSDYDMSDSEASIYNYALNTLASILPQVNTFDTDTQNQLQSEVDAYKDDGIKQINNLYNKNLTNMETDAASRFGNLDNSTFMDNMNDLEHERSDAVSSFAQDVLEKQSSLESDELTRRYSLIKLLSGLSDDIYDKALNAINTSLGSSSSASNYNSKIYDALSSLENTGSSSSLVSSILGSGISSSALLSLFSSGL